MILDRKYTGLPEGVPLNPMQQLIVPYMDEYDTNIVVQARTGSGKSTAITMCGNKYLEADDEGVIIYVGITKALADEKREDFESEDHPWFKYEKSTLTGDFKLNAAALKQLDQSRIVVTTPESLLSRLRNKNSDKSSFLNKVKMIVWDEIHLIADDSRGGNYETAVMEMSRAFPHVQLLGLSGTIPNANDFKQWFERISTNKTVMIQSDYRAVPVKYNFMPYDGASVHETEAERIRMIVELVTSKPDEQWMVCVWKKAFGAKVLAALNDAGYRFQFHHGSLTRDVRKNIEHAFKQKALTGIVCTQTLMTGVNTPARNVIISSMEFGRNPIPVYEILQAAGRAGRPRYDDMGFVYFFTPRRNAGYHKQRIEEGEPIHSTFNEVPTIATHFLGALYMNAIANESDFESWFRHTFYYLQASNNANFSVTTYLQTIVKQMRACKMVFHDTSSGMLSLTKRGTICAQMMLDPYHFSDMLRNFATFNTLINPNDVDLARAFGECSGYYNGWISEHDKRLIPRQVLNATAPEYVKHVAVVYMRITHHLTKQTVPGEFYSANFEIWQDAERYMEAVLRAQHESEGWHDVSAEGLRANFLRIIKSASYDEARLMVKAFTKAEAKKLSEMGMHSVADVKANKDLAATVLKPTRLHDLGIV